MPQVGKRCPASRQREWQWTCKITEVHSWRNGFADYVIPLRDLCSLPVPYWGGCSRGNGSDLNSGGSRFEYRLSWGFSLFYSVVYITSSRSGAIKTPSTSWHPAVWCCPVSILKASWNSLQGNARTHWTALCNRLNRVHSFLFNFKVESYLIMLNAIWFILNRSNGFEMTSNQRLCWTMSIVWSASYAKDVCFRFVHVMVPSDGVFHLTFSCWR